MIFITIIKIVVLSYTIASAYLFFVQDDFLFHTKHISKTKPNLSSYQNARLIEFKTEDNITLSGIEIKNSKNSPLVFYFGGNAEDVMNMVGSFKEFKEYNFIFFNYRGYGASQGKSSKEKILSDSIELYEHFSKNQKIYLIGRSLGSSVASYIASKKEVEKLILITPFDSIYNIAKDVIPFLPIKLLLKHNFDTKKYVESIETNTYMLVAKDDKITPKENSLNLKKSIKNLKLYKEVEGGHNSFYNKDFVEFLREAFRN